MQSKSRTPLTNFLDKGIKLRLVAQRCHKALDGSDQGLEGENSALLVRLAGPERVLEERIQNAANTKRGLNDGWGVLVDADLGGVDLDCNRLASQLDLLTTNLQLDGAGGEKKREKGFRK